MSLKLLAQGPAFRLSQRQYLVISAVALTAILYILLNVAPPPAGSSIPEVGSRPADGRIVVLYHIRAEGNWENIVRDQVTKLVFSGLYARLSLVHCLVLSPLPGAALEVENYLSGYGNKFTVLELPEPPTILQSIASIRNVTLSDRILFLSNFGTAKEEGTAAATAAFLWRTKMEYELIKDYRKCLQLLLQTDIVGAPSYLPFEAGPSNLQSPFWQTPVRSLHSSVKPTSRFSYLPLQHVLRSSYHILACNLFHVL